MQRNSPPFRAEHVGSLKRPAELLKKRTDYSAGACSLEDLRKLEDECIKRMVELQGSAGMKTLTDGELRRRVYFEGIFDRIEGVDVIKNSPPEYFLSYLPCYETVTALGISYVCQSKLRRTKCLYETEFLGLKKLVKPEEIKHIKLTLCGPEHCHFRQGPHTYKEGVYSNDEEYFADVVRVYREEIAGLYALGCRNIQVDEPNIAFFCDETMLRGMREQGIDPEALLERYIRLLDDCIRTRPADMTACVHLCRGNTKDGFASGGYGRIAAKLFQVVNADCFYLEYDTIRAGGFEPLKRLPSNKIVVLGLVSTRTPDLENPDKLRSRIFEAARIIADGRKERGEACSESDALNQICISPQCGFSSISQGTHNTVEEDIRRKLVLLAQVANSVWRE